MSDRSGARHHPVGTTLGAVGIVLAVVATALVALAMRTSPTGADTPEAAVEGLVAALVRQDPVAALDLITPAEIDGIDAVFGGLASKAEALDLLGEERLIDAVDLEITGLELATEQLATDLVRVVITAGEYRLRWDPDRLPERLAADGWPLAGTHSGDLVTLLGDAISAATLEQFDVGLLSAIAGDVAPGFLTLRTDDRWYVTLLGSYVDWIHLGAVNAAGGLAGLVVGEPDWEAVDEPVEPIVGGDPGEVLAGIEAAFAANDGRQLLANLPEELVRPLLPYHGLLSLLLRMVDVEVVDFTSTTTDLGRLVRVDVDRLDLRTIRFVELAVADGCLAVGAARRQVKEFCGVDGDGVFVILREVGDGYQFDPIATVVAHLDLAVGTLSEKRIEEFLDRLAERNR